MESPLKPDDGQNETIARDIERSREIALGRLLAKGLDVSVWATSDQLVSLLESVEAFEAAAAKLGCDPFTNSMTSSNPDDPDCVLPRPRADETIEAYVRRVRQQTGFLNARTE